MSWIEERKGRSCWVAVYKVDGKKMVKSTGVPLKQAGKTEKQLRKLAEDVAQGMEDAANKATPLHRIQDAVRMSAERAGLGAKMPTVREYLLAFQGQAGEKTESNRRRAFKVFLDYLGEGADMRLDMLTKDIVRGFIRHTLKEVSAGTVGLYRTNLAAAFNRALDDDLIARSPMPRINMSKEAAAVNPELGRDKVKRLPFTPAELNIIFERFPSPWREMSIVSYFTGGQRLGDVCMLRWADVDFDKGIVSFHTQKTGYEINCQMLPRLRTVLEKQKELQDGQQEYVFPGMARRYKFANGPVSSEFTALLKAYGIVKPEPDKVALKGRRRSVSPKSFHSFRHSFVSITRDDRAVTADMVRGVVGHESEEVERGYYHASRESQLKVLQAAERGLQTTAAPEMPPYPASA